MAERMNEGKVNPEEDLLLQPWVGPWMVGVWVCSLPLKPGGQVAGGAGAGGGGHGPRQEDGTHPPVPNAPEGG